MGMLELGPEEPWRAASQVKHPPLFAIKVGRAVRGARRISGAGRPQPQRRSVARPVDEVIAGGQRAQPPCRAGSVIVHIEVATVREHPHVTRAIPVKATRSSAVLQHHTLIDGVVPQSRRWTAVAVRCGTGLGLRQACRHQHHEGRGLSYLASSHASFSALAHTLTTAQQASLPLALVPASSRPGRGQPVPRRCP